MLYDAIVAKSPLACIESLEPRRLLSATHASPPVLTGTFSGTATATSGTITDLVLTITSETKTGAFRGSVSATTAGSTGGEPCTGTVNSKGKFTLHGKGSGTTLNATGTASATSISGKFNVHQRHFAAHGTFSLTNEDL